MRAISCLLVAGLLAACGEESDEAADYGVACINPECLDPGPDDYACMDVVNAIDPFTNNDVLGPLRDPLAVVVLKQPYDCPRTYAELLDKLRLEERQNCDQGGRAGLLTHMVSELGQTLGQPDVSRAVVFRECGPRAAYSLAFHVQGLDAADPQPPGDDVEVIALDASRALFNFYSLRGGVWTFHGNSWDVMGPDSVSECGLCHTGGGLLMRELQRPWGPWHGASSLPGALELVDRHEDLGQLQRAVNLEDLVRRGNRRWNLTRAAESIRADATELHQGSLRRMLQPLFCPTSFDLAQVGDLSLTGAETPVMRLRSDFFVDPMWGVEETIELDEGVYRQVATEVGTRVEGVPGATDTRFPWTYVRRADADVDYLQMLLDANLLDLDFVYDVLAVDPARPVFSPARCELLDRAPTFEQLGGTLNVESLRRAFRDSLDADPPPMGSWGARFAEDLADERQEFVHRARISDFVARCRVRADVDGGRELLRDAFAVQAERRKRAREFSSVLDTIGVIADDDLTPAAGTRFDTADCALAVQ